MTDVYRITNNATGKVDLIEGGTPRVAIRWYLRPESEAGRQADRYDDYFNKPLPRGVMLHLNISLEKMEPARWAYRITEKRSKEIFETFKAEATQMAARLSLNRYLPPSKKKQDDVGRSVWWSWSDRFDVLVLRSDQIPADDELDEWTTVGTSRLDASCEGEKEAIHLYTLEEGTQEEFDEDEFDEDEFDDDEDDEDEDEEE